MHGMKTVNEEIREDEILSDYCILSGGNDRSLNFWSTKKQNILYSLPDAHNRFINDIKCIDEESFLSAGGDVVKLWSVSSMKNIRTFYGHSDTVRSIITMDSRTFLSGSDDSSIRLYSVRNSESKTAFNGHTNYVTDLCKMSSLKFCSSSYDGTVRMWDVSKNIQMNIYKQEGEIYCLDSNIPFRLFSLGSFGGNVRILNKDFEKIIDLRGDNAVSSVHIVSDKNYLLCGDITGSIYCWDLRMYDRRLWKKVSVHKKNKGVEKIITLTEEFYASCGGDGSIVVDTFFEREYDDGNDSDSDSDLGGEISGNPYAQFQVTRRREDDDDDNEEEEEFVVIGNESQVVKGRKKTRVEKEEEEEEEEEERKNSSSRKSKFGRELKINTKEAPRRCFSSRHNLLLQSGIKSITGSPSPGDFVDRMKFRENGPVRSILLLPGNNVNIFLKKEEIKKMAMIILSKRKKKRREENENEEF